MTDLLDKAGSGSVEPEDFNAVVDAIESGPTGKVTAADIDSLAAQDGDVLTADGAGNATWETVGGSQPVQQIDVPLSSAELLGLSTPMVLVPGVTGKAIAPLLILMTYTAGETPYVDQSSNLTFYAEGGTTWLAMPGATPFWDQTTDQTIAMLIPPPVGPFPTASLAGDLLMVINYPPLDGDGTLLLSIVYALPTLP